MNTREKLQLNTKILQIVLENTTGKYSAKEIETIKQWQGLGNFKALLFNDGPIEEWSEASKEDKSLYNDYMKLYSVLDDNLTGKQYTAVKESLKNSLLSSYYTPSVIPTTFYDVMAKYSAVESIYDPCAGGGVFIINAIGKLSLQNEIVCYEKDILTGKVLQAIISSIPKSCATPVVNIKGFEESDPAEDNSYDLLASNVPYGNYAVYDPTCNDKTHSTKIHNYFIWKGLQKVREGGIMAVLVTNAFLDTVSNKSAREYLFMHSDFISLTVMPDNLMKDIANTEAPSHFLVVRKNSSKIEMSAEEKLLCVSEMHTSSGITFPLNKYCQKMCGDIVIGNVQIGKNQYGKPAREVWWDGKIEDISTKFAEILSRDFSARYKQPKGIEIPVGKVEILGPGKWKWKEDEIGTLPHDSGKTVAEAFPHIKFAPSPQDEIPPWEELPNHVQLPVDYEYKSPVKEGEMIWDDEIVDIPKEFDEDETPPWEEDEGEDGHRQGNISEEEYEQEIEEESKAQEETPVKEKGPSKRDKEVMAAYQEIKSLYTALEIAEQENQ